MFIKIGGVTDLKKSVMEPLFSQVISLRALEPEGLRLQHRYISTDFAKILRTFFYRTPSATASGRSLNNIFPNF